VIGLVAVTAAGRAHAERLAAAWPGRTRSYPAPAAEALPAAFAECEGVVAFLATGATARLLAPALAQPDADKLHDPGVVCVDEAARFAVALIGGHAGGANALALDVAEVLGAKPVITTATDAAGLPGLDVLGLPAEGDIGPVTRALLDGDPVRLDTAGWPLPAFPPTASDGAPPTAPRILVTDRTVTPADAGLPPTVTLRPPSLVLGVGASRNAPVEDLAALVADVLHDAGLASVSVREVVSADVKADEPAIRALAADLGVPFRTLPADVLAEQDVPNPSDVVAAAVGTPSVAEAAVMAAGAELVVPKRARRTVTVAVGRFAPRGRLAIVGLGPGARDLITPRAVTELRRASVVVGLDQYVDQIRDLLRPGTDVLASGLGAEEERARTAVAQAQRGRAVALIGSGDAGVYAMASPALEALDDALADGGPPIDVAGVPGVTAALAAAASLGAPLGHDHAYVSLSDLHTPWPAIERRLHAAAEADVAVALYNPRSRGRAEHLDKALAILAAHRPPTTPIGLVRDATRPGERVVTTTLGDIDTSGVDMLTVVIVGSSATRVAAGRMVTPRGYRWRAADDGAPQPRTRSSNPHPIERESYRILRSRADTGHLPCWSRAVAERVVHASADLGYLDDLELDEAALAAAAEALAAGAPIVADAAMVASGVTARQALVLVGDPRTRERADRTGLTRSAAAMHLAAEQVAPGAIWVVGNAPTALEAVIDLAPQVRPALVIGLPVGFVGATESKARLRASGLPAVSNRSEKGGSAVASAAVNALLYGDPLEEGS
jgi:cobalt-precorrin 5A hydrolase/precorrin-3B C17-methyltransferase